MQSAEEIHKPQKQELTLTVPLIIVIIILLSKAKIMWPTVIIKSILN